MPFSLTSYLLGVATVVGVLAFSFGGGALVKTAIKEPAAAPTRVERVARSEPEPTTSAQPRDTKDNSPPPAEPEPARLDQAPAAQAAVTQAASPSPDTSKATESAKRSEPSTKQPEPTKQAAPASQAEQKEQKEQKEGIQKRTVERKIERQKHYAERKAGSFATSRTKRPPSEDSDQPERTDAERTEFVFSREEPNFFAWEGRHEQPHFNLFQMLSPPPFDRDD